MKNIKPWHAYPHMAFDVDGTLLDSNIAHVWAWQDALETEGLFFPHMTLFMQMGLPGKKIVEKYRFLMRDKETAERVAKAAGEIYSRRYVELVAPYQGVYELLETLKRQGHCLYAVTSASKTEADAMFKRFKLDTYFDDAMTAEESGEGKPSADPFLRLKAKVGARASILSIGDSPYDLKASHEAGLPFLYLAHGGFAREWFNRAEYQYFNIKQLLAEMARLKLPRRRSANAA